MKTILGEVSPPGLIPGRGIRRADGKVYPPGRGARKAWLEGIAALAACFSAAPAADLWYEDNNLARAGGTPPDFVRKFDQPASFQRASRHIQVYMVRANVLSKQDDTFLRDTFLPYLERNGIKLAIDAQGATWAQAPGREQVKDREIHLLERLKRLGGRVDYLSLQSALSKSLQVAGEERPYPMKKRIGDVVSYAKAARAVYQEAEIGIIDALPSLGKSYREPYRQLRDGLAREGLKLAFIHLDMPFEYPAEHIHGNSWQKVAEIERYVEALGVRFGFFATSRKAGYQSSRAFHERVIAALECTTEAGSTPGEFIIASWFPHPGETIPETATGRHYPAMRTVLEFGRRLKQIDKKTGASRQPDPG